LASLFHCKIDAVRRAFELGSLFVAKRLAGDDKQAINLSSEDLHLVAGGRAAELLGLKV